MYFNLKEQKSFVSFWLTVTLWMMSNNPQISLIHRSCTCKINCSIGMLLRRLRNRLTLLVGCLSPLFPSFLQSELHSACFFYWQVIDHRCWSGVVFLSFAEYRIYPILQTPTLTSDKPVRFCGISSQRPTEPSIVKLKVCKSTEDLIVQYAG